AVRSALAEDGFERTKLAAVPHDDFHVGKRLEEKHRLALEPGQRARLALFIDEEVCARFVNIDPLKIPKVHRIRRRGPDRAEEIGIGDLKPKAAPATRRMTGHEAGCGYAECAILLLDVRNQLFHKRSAAGTVILGIRKDMMAQRA